MPPFAFSPHGAGPRRLPPPEGQPGAATTTSLYRSGNGTFPLIDAQKWGKKKPKIRLCEGCGGERSRRPPWGDRPGPARAGPGWALRDAAAARAPPSGAAAAAGGRAAGEGGRTRSAPLSSWAAGERRHRPRHGPFSLRRQMWRRAGGAAPGWARKTRWRRRRQVFPPRPGRGHERGGGTVNRPPAPCQVRGGKSQRRVWVSARRRAVASGRRRGGELLPGPGARQDPACARHSSRTRGPLLVNSVSV